MAIDTTGGYCPQHDQHYSKIEQCAVCRAERAGTVVQGSPKADTSAARVHAAEYRLRELACWDYSKSNAADDPHVAVKWSAESAKWARLATETELQLLEIEHDQWLMDQDKKRRGGN